MKDVLKQAVKTYNKIAKIYADYTVQEYSNLSAGIAFSFR